MISLLLCITKANKMCSLTKTYTHTHRVIPAKMERKTQKLRVKDFES